MEQNDALIGQEEELESEQSEVETASEQADQSPSESMEDLLEVEGLELDFPKQGEIRTGIIATISEGEVLVSVGTKSEGVLSGRELELIPEEERNTFEVGKEIPVYGQGLNVRDWLFVEDHADALLLVLEKGMLGRSYNIGGENEARNIDLVQSICTILDRKRPKDAAYSDQINFVQDRAGHDLRYAIDPTRIRDELGWRPSVTLDEGLERTVDWYLENEDWWRALQARDGVGERLGVKA